MQGCAIFFLRLYWLKIKKNIIFVIVKLPVQIYVTLHGLLICFQHEPDGVPLNLLRDELKDEGITDHIPEARLNNILVRADRDGDERIDFVEFMKMVSYFIILW